MEALRNISRVFQGAFKPRNTMAPKPPATPITHDQNRIETPRPTRDQSDESQRPPTRDGNHYATGVFALIPTGGRKSLDSSTERDSPTATRKSSQPAVPEFRNVHQKNGFSGKGRPRRQPGQSQQSSHAPKSSPKLPSAPARNHRRVEDIEDEEEDVLLLHEQLPKPKPKHGAIRSSEQVDLTGEDQATGQELTIVIPAIPADRLGRKRAKADSPDELNDDDYPPGRANKRSKGMPGTAPRAGKSSSLSSKGDIGSTFYPRRGTGPVTSGRDLPQFRLKAAVCLPRSICDDAQVLVPRQSDPRMLDPRRSGGQDAPVDNRAQHALPYEWLQVCLATMNRLSYSPDHQHITIERPSFKDFGGKLFLKFLDQEDGRNFVAWAEKQMGDKAKLVIQEAANTEKQFDNARGHVESFARSQAEKRAETRRSREQTTHNSKADRLGPNADDVILMALNRRREGAKTGALLGGPGPTQPPSARKRLRESMADDVVAIAGPEPAQPPSAKKRLRESMADDAVAVEGDADVREVKRPNIERRSTRLAPAPSAVVAVNSPRAESSPPPRAWTLEHPGWDKEWRLPLTYHRTIIHKEDVARLDDGEFLNDSIISFYLNYLHNRLKATDKDTAARFYFHNSFFYERLKPAKGKSINYDNIKSWTSRVDIFQYDFIIVPVNEHSHWWVAVICNPGKLVPDEPASTPEVGATKTVANEPGPGARDDSEDAERNSKGLPEVPKKSSKDCPVPSSPAMSPRTASLREKMESMSLSQKDAATPAKQAPILIDDEPDNQVIIPDDEAPDPPRVVSDIPSLNNPKANEPVRAKGSSQRESPQAQQPVLLTGKEPRVITLDSLGSAHSPACTHLKQYLCEELLDKKKQQVKMPSTFGLTAKAIPLQSNHWDCGAYLLSYIDFLMKDPDASIKALLEKRSPGWHVDASKTRSEIRDVIIKEHAACQKEEEAAARAKQEQKRLRKGRAAASSVTGSSPARPTSEAVPLPSRPPEIVAPPPKAAAPPEDIVRPSIEHSNVSVSEVLATN